MDAKVSSLKLKLYLFSSADAEKQQDQKQLPVKENKDGSSTGPTTYVFGMTIRRIPYGDKINPSEFCKRL